MMHYPFHLLWSLTWQSPWPITASYQGAIRMHKLSVRILKLCRDIRNRFIRWWITNSFYSPNQVLILLHIQSQQQKQSGRCMCSLFSHNHTIDSLWFRYLLGLYLHLHLHLYFQSCFTNFLSKFRWIMRTAKQRSWQQYRECRLILIRVKFHPDCSRVALQPFWQTWINLKFLIWLMMQMMISEFSSFISI